MFWAAGGVSAIFTLAFAALLEHVENIANKVNNLELNLANKTTTAPRTSAELIADLSK
ncbi:hypothetical protein D3C86_1971420 [compost metagenome]